MTLYAVMYCETPKMRDIIPDLIFISREKAEQAAKNRSYLNGLEDEIAKYDVIPITVRDWEFEDLQMAE